MRIPASCKTLCACALVWCVDDQLPQLCMCCSFAPKISYPWLVRSKQAKWLKPKCASIPIHWHWPQRRPRVAFYLRLWLSLCCLFDHSCIYNYTPFTFCLYACTEIVHMHNSELITDVNQSKARDVCMHFNAFPQYCSCFNRVLCSRVRRLQSRSWRCLCDTFVFELAT